MDLGSSSKRKPRSGGKRGFHWEARIGGSTRFMDKTRERAKRFKPALKNSNIAKTARPPKTATPLSGVCSPGGAAVELDGNVPVLIGLRPHKKVQRTVMIFCSGGTAARQGPGPKAAPAGQIAH